MPREGNSSGYRAAKQPSRSGGRNYTDQEWDAMRRDYKESPTKFQGAVRREDANARADYRYADNLSDMIANHDHFNTTKTDFGRDIMNRPLTRDEYANYSNKVRAENRSRENTANNFYNKFDNPNYAGTPGRDRENDNSSRAMGMDAKARARQAARSRNNPTNPNDR